MKNNFKKIVVSIIVLILLAIVFLPKLLSSSSSQKDNIAGNMSNQIINVKAHIAAFESLSNRVNTTGTIFANEEVELRSEISGKIVSILFREGSFVSKGDLLVKINDADLQAQLRRAESKVKLSEEKNLAKNNYEMGI